MILDNMYINVDRNQISIMHMYDKLYICAKLKLYNIYI